MLINLAEQHTWREVSGKLGRTCPAVRIRASNLGVSGSAMRRKRGLTPCSLALQIGSAYAVVYRVSYYLFPRLREMDRVIYTPEEAEEIRAYFIERGLKTRDNPDGHGRGRPANDCHDRFLGADSAYRKASPYQVTNKAGDQTNGG